MKPSRPEVVLRDGPAQADTCKHRWVIDTPAGPISKGACRICGEVREFKNYLDAPYWEDDLGLDQVSSGARFRSSASVAAPVETEE